jgi:hypothetical protein
MSFSEMVEAIKALSTTEKLVTDSAMNAGATTIASNLRD